MRFFSSEKFKLNASDFVKSLLMAVLTAVLTTVYKIFETSGGWPTGDDWGTVAKVAFGAAIAYLIKNFLSAPAIPPDGTPTASEVKKYEDVK